MSDEKYNLAYIEDQNAHELSDFSENNQNLDLSDDIKTYQPKSTYFSKVNNQYQITSKLLFLFKFALLFAWLVYLGIAVYWDFTGEFSDEKLGMEYPSLPLLAVTVISFLFYGYGLMADFFDLSTITKKINKTFGKYLTITIFTAVFALCILFIVLTLKDQTNFSSKQWISLLGYFILPVILIFASAKPRNINPRPVFGGLLIQLIFAIFITTSFGSQLFEYLGGLAQTVLNFVEEGYLFLFGEEIVASSPFAFTVLPICIYISSVVGVLYFLGAMEWLIKKIGFVMYSVLRTSATESMVASGNIFIGQSEAPLLIRPYLKDSTDSELLAIMAAGMGTVAGSTLGAYINFGVDPVYVITASFMAAPTVLALSKIMYPETEKSKFKNFDEMKCEKDETIENVVDAAARGATDAVPLVANIAACLIAFMSIARAVNELLSQLGRLVGLFDPLITLDLIFSYIFYPISFILGVDQVDLFKVSELLGKKLIINEFIAYQEMTDYIPFRAAGCLRDYWISKRSECITTYSLCGFANISSMAITLGGLGPMAPNKRQNMSKIVFRALIVGCFTSFLNGALNGFLGRTSVDYDIENEDGFYTSCAPFCCAYAKNNNTLIVEDPDQLNYQSFCNLETPPEELNCFYECELYNFTENCTVAISSGQLRTTRAVLGDSAFENIGGRTGFFPKKKQVRVLDSEK